MKHKHPPLPEFAKDWDKAKWKANENNPKNVAELQVWTSVSTKKKRSVEFFVSQHDGYANLMICDYSNGYSDLQYATTEIARQKAEFLAEGM